MDLKEIFAKLETVEGGADMIAGIKAEQVRLRNESKTNRTKYEGILSALDLEDNDDVITSVGAIKKGLDDVKGTGKKPDELMRSLKELTDKVDTMTKTAANEKEKRISATKMNKALAALQAGKAVDPQTLSQLIIGNIEVKDDDSVVFKEGDKEMSVEDGVKAFLTARPWAVANSQEPGAGSGGGGGGEKATEYDKMSMEEFVAARQKELEGK